MNFTEYGRLIEMRPVSEKRWGGRNGAVLIQTIKDNFLKGEGKT
jgi:hypothetical protein